MDKSRRFPENHIYLEQRKWVKNSLHNLDLGLVLRVFIPVTEIHQGSFKLVKRKEEKKGTTITGVVSAAARCPRC